MYYWFHKYILIISLIFLNEFYYSLAADNVNQINDIDYLLDLSDKSLQELLFDPETFDSLNANTLESLLSIPFLAMKLNPSLIDQILSKYNDKSSSSDDLSILTTSQSPLDSFSNNIIEPEYPDENSLLEATSDLDNFDELAFPAPQLDFNLDDHTGIELALLLNSYNQKQVKDRMDTMSADTLIRLANKKGFLTNLKDEIIIIISDRVDVITNIDLKVALIPLTNERPELLKLIPMQSLDTLAKLPQFIMGLSPGVIKLLVHNLEMSSRVNLLSLNTLRTIVTFRPEIMVEFSKIQPNNPLKKRVTHLLTNVEFLEKIPLSVHLYLANTKFRETLTKDSLLSILKAHPNLPMYFSDKLLNFYGNRMILDDSFLSHVSCSVFINGARNITFVDRLSADFIGALSQNLHVWDCIPTRIMDELLQHSNIGSKLRITDAISAVRTAASLSRGNNEHRIGRLFWKVVRYQTPNFKRQYLF